VFSFLLHELNTKNIAKVPNKIILFFMPQNYIFHNNLDVY